MFIGFPGKFAKPAFYAGLVSPDFTGDNRRGAPQSSNQCGDCYSTQKSAHKSTVIVPVSYGKPGWARQLGSSHSRAQDDLRRFSMASRAQAGLTLNGFQTLI